MTREQVHQVPWVDLLLEQGRHDAALSRVDTYMKFIGTHRGPKKFDYSQLEGLDRIMIIGRIGEIRGLIQEKTIPTIKKRQQEVEAKKQAHPFTQAQSQVNVIKELHAKRLISDQELKIAQDTLDQLGKTPSVSHPGINTAPKQDSSQLISQSPDLTVPALKTNAPDIEVPTVPDAQARIETVEAPVDIEDITREQVRILVRCLSMSDGDWKYKSKEGLVSEIYDDQYQRTTNREKPAFVEEKWLHIEDQIDDFVRKYAEYIKPQEIDEEIDKPHLQERLNSIKSDPILSKLTPAEVGQAAKHEISYLEAKQIADSRKNNQTIDTRITTTDTKDINLSDLFAEQKKPGERTKPVFDSLFDPQIESFEELVSLAYAEEIASNPDQKDRIVRRYRFVCRDAVIKLLDRLDKPDDPRSGHALLLEIANSLRQNEGFMSLSGEERLSLATREPGYKPLLEKVIAAEKVEKPNAEDLALKELRNKIDQTIQEENVEGKKRLFIVLPNGQKYSSGVLRLSFLSGMSFGSEEAPISGNDLIKAVYLEDLEAGVPFEVLRDRASVHFSNIRSDIQIQGYEIVNANKFQGKVAAEYYLKAVEPVEPAQPKIIEDEGKLIQARQAYENILILGKEGHLSADQLLEAGKRHEILFGSEDVSVPTPPDGSSEVTGVVSSQPTAPTLLEGAPKVIEYQVPEHYKRTPKETRVLNTIIQGLTDNSRLWFDRVQTGVIDRSEPAEEVPLPANQIKRFVDDAKSLFSQFKAGLEKLEKWQTLPKLREQRTDEDIELYNAYRHLTEDVMKTTSYEEFMKKVEAELNKCQREYMDLHGLSRSERPYIIYHE